MAKCSSALGDSCAAPGQECVCNVLQCRWLLCHKQYVALRQCPVAQKHLQSTLHMNELISMHQGSACLQANIHMLTIWGSKYLYRLHSTPQHIMLHPARPPASMLQQTVGMMCIALWHEKWPVGISSDESDPRPLQPLARFVIRHLSRLLRGFLSNPFISNCSTMHPALHSTFTLSNVLCQQQY